MINLEYSGKKFKVTYPYNITNSVNDVAISSVTIDFTGYKLEDLPYKYQEIKIINDETNKVLFTGYFDSPEFSDMKLPNEERTLTLNLLSPLKIAQHRCVTLIGTYKIKEAVNRILQPLIDDGYVIKEMNIGDSEIILNHVLQTVDYCMNDIGHKRNILWFIDSEKNIYINSLDYLFSKEEKLSLNEETYKEGLFYIQPTITPSDYANVINIKNIRLFYSEKDSYYNKVLENHGEGILLNLPKNIKKGDIVSFNYPIVVDEKQLFNYINELESSAGVFVVYCVGLTIKKSDGTVNEYSIGIDLKDMIFNTNGNITFSDDKDTEGDIVLQRDSFFSNLITGFKYNVDDDSTIVQIQSNTALRYTSMRFMNNKEINKLKGIVSLTGQLEKTVDYADKWATIDEITEYAKSLIIENTNVINSINIKLDEDYNLNLGDIIEINMPNFYINGNFAVSNINYSCINSEDEEWNITMQNADIIGSYIDIFRAKEHQTTEDTTSTMILCEYLEESIEEIHEIEVLDNEN